MAAAHRCSFAIVLWEIGSGKTPYYERRQDSYIDLADLQRAIVIERLRPREIDVKSCVPYEFIGLMRECWQHGAHVRPAFPDIVGRLEALRPDFKPFPSKFAQLPVPLPSAPRSGSMSSHPRLAGRYDPPLRALMTSPAKGLLRTNDSGACDL